MRRFTGFRQSIGMRFMVVTFIVISALIAISSLFSAWYMVKATEKKLLEDYRVTLDFTSNQIEDYVDEITRYCALVAADSNIQKLLMASDSFSELDKVRYSVEIYRNLRYYELLRDDCINIELYLYNGNIFTSDSSNKNTLHSTGDTSWFDNALKSEQAKVFSKAHELQCRNIFYDNAVTYICNMANYNTNQEKIGKIFLHLKQDAFRGLLYKMDIDNFWCGILNSQNEILAQSGEKNEDVESWLRQMEEITALSGKADAPSGTEKGGHGWILYNNGLKCGLRLVMYVPDARLQGEVKDIFLFFLLLYVSCIFVSVLVMIPAARRFSNPISALSNAARQISEGRLDVHIKAENQDEIGTLTEVFNQMALSIEHQMRDLQEAERERADLQMSILMAQINPHFIYNTLNSAIYLSKTGESKKAERLLMLFISLLQNNMKSGIDGIITTLGEEVRDVQEYIELQQIRYPERFTFVLNGDERLYHHAVPRLFLQPLIENALNHGILPRESGKIELTIYEKEGWLIFRLADDGEGMSEERVRSLLKWKDSGEKGGGRRRSASKIHSISIENICQRLALLYKEEYRFEIKSSVGKGTEILISFPTEYR